MPFTATLDRSTVDMRQGGEAADKATGRRALIEVNVSRGSQCGGCLPLIQNLEGIFEDVLDWMQVAGSEHEQNDNQFDPPP